MKISRFDMLIYRLFYWRWNRILANNYAIFALFKESFEEYAKQFDVQGNPKGV